MRFLGATMSIGFAAVACACARGAGSDRGIECDGCDAGADTVAEVATEAAPDAASEEDPPLFDATADVRTDARSDAPSDSPADCPAEAPHDAAKAVFDAGCGPLDTVTNCSACGAACDTIHSAQASCNGTTCLYQSCDSGWANCDKTPPDTDGCETDTTTTANCAGCGNACDVATGTPACSGATCSYACKAGRSDCNQTPPNLDGCECATPGCCGNSCQFTHIDGLGQTFYDCAPPGTYNVTQATAACAAFTGDVMLCATVSCKSGSAVCSATFPNACACWAYAGNAMGHVHDSGVGGQCYCPAPNEAAWD